MYFNLQVNKINYIFLPLKLVVRNFFKMLIAKEEWFMLHDLILRNACNSKDVQSIPGNRDGWRIWTEELSC